jgi:hypothetical protein
LLAARRTLAGGLLWAAAMLVLLAVWLGVKDASPGVLLWGPVLVLAAAALAGAVWQFRRPAAADAPEPEAVAALLKQRRTLATALFAGAFVLLLLGLWLSAQQGLAAFPEVSSMVVLALIAAGAGASQLVTVSGRLSRERLVEAVAPLASRAILGLISLGGLAVVVLWRMFRREAVPITPETVGALTFGVVCLIAWGWYRVAQHTTPPLQTLRFLILMVGGALGLIVALATAWRIWLWWGEIFPREVPMAESQEIWRLWLCLYVELFALAIVFGSLMLGRADIRQDPVVRRLLFGYNTVLTGLLLLATLVLANVMVYVTYPYTVEWTESLGLHSLSPSTKNLLQALKEPVRVYAILPQNSALYKELRPLLENAQAYTRMLQVEYVSPDRDEVRYQKLVQKFPVLLREAAQFRMEREEVGRGVLLVYGPEEAGKPPHAFITRNELEDVTPDKEGRRKVVFKGEDAIMTQLRLLADREKRPKIYFTQSNEELDLTDEQTQLHPLARDRRGGAGLLLKRLKKDNYDVRGLFWESPPRKGKVIDLFVFSQAGPKDPHEVPADASLVIIAHPLEPFTKEVLAALERYLDQRGGKLIVLTNLLPSRDLKAVDMNLGGLLQKYNVKFGDDFLMRFNLDQDPLTVIATPPEHTRNRVAENFRTSRFPVGGMFVGRSVGMARSVRSQAPTGAYEVQTLLEVGPKLNGTFWAETDLNVLRNLGAYLQNLAVEDKLDAKKSNEPIPVAVGVTDRGGKPRLAVFGDARFASNLFVRGPAPYYDFLTSTIEWLAERPENMGIRPRESTSYTIQPEAVNKQRLIWLPLGLVLLFFVGLGMGIWVVRRR